MSSVYFPSTMSTVTEIKQAVGSLPPRKKLELVRWIQTQVNEGEDAPMFDHRETTRVKGMSKEESAEARRFLNDFAKAVKTIAAGPRPGGSIVATLAKMRR